MATNTNEREEIKPVAPTEQTKWRDPSLVGKYMVDPKTGLAGLFRSPDNGETWVLTDTVYGHVYNQDEVDNIWDNGAGHKVADEIKSATADLPNVRKQADSAVKFAESAIAASKVNSDAIVAQSSAVVEAKSAMDSATAEIQQTAANAASDAAKIRADVARVQSEVDTTKAANSASVEALKSDIGSAKKDLADIHDSLDKAQSAIEQNQKLINDSVAKITSDVSATKQDLADVHDSLTKAQAAAEQNQKAIDKSIAQINDSVDATNQDLADVRKDLTKAQSDITANQKAVNDNVAQINSNIEQDRKDIASAQQANADTAKQLDTYSKQATEQGKTIKTIQDKQDGFTATLADVQGNVSQVSDKVDGLSASLKDTQGNVASVKAQADQLSATLTNHGKSIATLTASAKELSSTLEDADGRLSKVEQTAQTNSSTLSDVQGDLSQVKQDATTLTATLKDAQGNISTLQQKADSVSAQLASAQGDIATLQTGVDGVKATLTSHDKSIHTLQADSKSLKDSMVNAQGDISTLRKTATDVTSELEDHTGRLSKVEQTASKQETTLSDLQGNLSQVEQKADSNTTTISSINKNAMQDRGVITDTNTSFDSLTHLGTYSIKAIGLPKMPEQHYGTLAVSGSAGSGWISQQFVADTTGNVYTRVFSNNAWSAWKQGGSQDAINQVKQTADSNSATIRNVQGDVSTLKQTATGIKSTLASHEGDIHTLQADSKSLKDSMTNAQGDISTLQKSATSLDSEMKDHTGRLSKVEQTASKQETTLSDLQGNLSQVEQKADSNTTTISSINKNAMQDRGVITDTNTSFDSLTHLGTYSIKAIGLPKMPEQHYGTLAVSGSAGSGWISQQFVADTTGNVYTRVFSNNAWSAWKQGGSQDAINQVKQTADSNSATIRNVQGDVSTLKQTATGIKSTLASHEGDIHTLQSDSKSLHDSMQDAQGDISTLKKTSTDVTSELKDHAGRISKAEQTASTLVNEFADQQGHLNRVEQTAQGTQQTVANQQGQINNIKTDAAGMHQTIIGQGNQIANINVTLNGLNTKYEGVSGDLDKLKDSNQWKTVNGAFDANQYTQTARIFYQDTQAKNTPDPGWFYLLVEAPRNDRVTQTLIKDTYDNSWSRFYTGKWSVWTKGATQLDIDSLSNQINTNSTQITQNKQAIALKADQTTVDNLSGEVSQNKAQLTVQAGQISSKVSSSEYQTLKDKVNGMKVGTRNLLHNTSDQYRTLTGEGWMGVHTSSDEYTSVANYHGGDRFTYAATINNTSDVPVELQVWRCDQNKNRLGMLGISAYVQPGQHNMRVSLTGSMDSSTWYLQSAIYSSSGQSGQHTIQVKDERLVEGNIEGTWEANPADIVASIQKNSTAIDQTNKQISLKADQTEVNQVKGTASENSSRLDTMANEIKSKVTSTDVNNIVNGKGYATTSTVQSLVDQKAGALNESITNLEGKFNSSSSVNLAEKTNQGTTNWIVDPGNGTTTISEVNINGIRGVRFTQTRKSTSWWVIAYQLNLDYFEPNQDYIISFDMRTSSDNFSQGGMLNIARGDSSHAYLANTSFRTNFKKNQLTHVSCTGHSYSSLDKNGETFYLNCVGLGQCDWVDIVNLKIARGTIDKGYSPAPSDNATVTQIQQVTASINGLQSMVANKADKSQITQLSNVIQSKVSASDFNALKDEATWKSTDSIDLNTAVLQQKIFVKGGSNLPPGNYWWYVQVEPGYDSRIVQYAVSDRDNIHYSRQYDGSKWSAWSQGATESEITQLRDDINLRVKSGDLLSQINLTAGNTLIQSNKLYLDASSVVFSGRAFIPSAAIASLNADKVNTGWLNTNNVNLGDGRTRIRADHDYMYIQPTGSASSNTGIRMGYSGLDFLTNVIPNGYSSSVPYYSVGYDGTANGYFKISAFDHINPGGTTATQNWFTMYDAISLNNKEVNIAANNKPRIRVTDNGIEVRPTIFFNNENYSGTWAGFNRLDNSNTVEFNTGDNDGENFHVNSGARFMKYVYFNDYCRAQGWLTYSTLSKKTNIKKLDTSLALDKIRQDDQYLYEYKRNVAKGVYDPQASFIIDDVNDVSHYSVPREFIDQTGKYREPSVELSYLIAAFQEIDKQVQTQKEEIKELKEKLQHE